MSALRGALDNLRHELNHELNQVEDLLDELEDGKQILAELEGQHRLRDYRDRKLAKLIARRTDLDQVDLVGVGLDDFAELVRQARQA